MGRGFLPVFLPLAACGALVAVAQAGCVGDDAAPPRADGGDTADSTAPGNDAGGGGQDGGGGGQDGGVDAPLVCEAGTTPCGGACVDLQSSPDHCNACGHSCGGGACVTGLCQTHTLATGVAQLHAIGLDSTKVYFTAGNLVQGCLKGGPCSGAGLTKLADFTGLNEDGTGDLSARDGRVAFVGNTNGDSRFYMCPTTGCPSLASLGVSQVGYNAGIALVNDGNADIAFVYHASAGVQSASCPNVGSCTNIVTKQPRANADSPVAATATHYYYVKRAANVAVGLARCPASETPCTTVQDISNVSAGVRKLVTTSTELFVLWAGGQGGGSAIGRCPLAGCASNGAPAVVRSSISTYDDMTVEGTDAFWVEGGVLKTCPFTSCAAPKDLATGLTNVSSLIADTKFVYWIEGANGNNGAIRRVAR